MSLKASELDIYFNHDRCWRIIRNIHKYLLTSVLPLPSSAWCWCLCGSRHHSSCLLSVWGPALQPPRNLHTHDAEGNEPSTDGLPSQCLRRGLPGTPTEERREAVIRGEAQWFRLIALIAEDYLGGHNFRVGTIDINPRVEAGFVVTLHNVPSICMVCSHSTVIRALKWKEKS